MGAFATKTADYIPVSEAAGLADDVRSYLRVHGRLGNTAHLMPVAITRIGYRVTHMAEPSVPECYDKVETEDMQIHARYGPDNTLSVIPIRIYRYQTGETPLAAAASDNDVIVQYMHGGGFAIGSIATHDQGCRLLCAQTRWTVVSVEYALAPEHSIMSFPNAFDDCVYAYEWATRNVAHILRRESSADSSRESSRARFVLCGDSAGGMLTLGVATRLRDHNRAIKKVALPDGIVGPFATARCGRLRDDIGLLPEPVLLAPIYPLVQHEYGVPASHSVFASRRKYEWGYELTAAMVGAFSSLFFGPDVGLHAALDKDVLLNPLLHPDVSDLPHTILLAAEFDVLHDEGVAYVEKLRAARVKAEHVEGHGQIHGYSTHHALMPSGRAILKQYFDKLRTAVHSHD